ncbi:hypothetical protein MGYG_00135 [Nannizzia gypsea CBS 118893]|uniref:RRM domain-containing protein n=1 Tax=Arthroderma gypseum (strain ATCC MYA-4604 / CBS 118893) TaxID=535722 RepID=E5R363_ARTGP|nr:hypothetical protein MGYG_00135 [Nannizzia gypsea CBS 118893]EFQ97092.1 hypothetical protein MGYG_00135 [Nannizzia gypsea CBS 118893]
MSQKAHQKASPGVLAINPSATQKAAPPPAPSKGHSSKGNAPRLKLHVRRLPPGLTQAEFESTLGDYWKVGQGKIDWFLFKEGKVSTDPSKPSRPGRAYLRVTSSVTIPELSEAIRQTAFRDARNTCNDSALLGPPTLEYAPFSRVPSVKTRNDARVGTIDQDAEFIAFLESLTNPVTKPPEEETAETADKAEKPTITPLIQYLREKKANKAKEVAAAKAAKQARSAAVKESKTEKPIGKKQLLSRADKSIPEKQKKDKTAKEVAVKDAVKAANKQAANGSTKPDSKASPGPANPAPPTSPAPERRRERGSLTAATKILRRDLGLTTPTRRREKAGQSSSSGPGGSSATESAKKDQPSSSKSENNNNNNNPASTPKGKNTADSTPKPTPSKQTKGTPPTEPAAARNAGASRKTANTPTTPNNKASGQKTQQQQQSSQSPSSNGTQAFLKHANPSQGVTEDLLQKGFSQFGKVIRVEIDKKKGFGYVDFAEPAGLRKAIDASPVSIAQSQVVVLERRTSTAVAQNRGHGNRGGGGGGGGGGGQGTAPGNAQQQAAPQGSRPAQTGSSPAAAPTIPPTASPASRGTPPGTRGRGPRRGYGRGGVGGRGK